jgi:hypothetical protein
MRPDLKYGKITFTDVLNFLEVFDVNISCNIFTSPFLCAKLQVAVFVFDLPMDV